LLFDDALLNNSGLVKCLIVSQHKVRSQPLFSGQHTFNAKSIIELAIFKDALIILHVLIAFFIVIVIVVFIVIILVISLHILRRLGFRF
jgi:hypothetical protein